MECYKLFATKGDVGSDEVKNPGARLSFQRCLSCPWRMQAIEILNFQDDESLLSLMATHLLHYYCCEYLCCEWVILQSPAQMMVCSGRIESQSLLNYFSCLGKDQGTVGRWGRESSSSQQDGEGMGWTAQRANFKDEFVGQWLWASSTR